MRAVSRIKDYARGRWRELPTHSGRPTLNEAARYFAGHGTPLNPLTKRVSSDCRKRFNNKRPKPEGMLPLADRQTCAPKCCDWPRDATVLSVKSFSENSRVKSSRNQLKPPTK